MKSVEGQSSDIRAGCDILIATASRLEYLLRELTISLADTKVFFLDEADTFFDCEHQRGKCT